MSKPIICLDNGQANITFFNFSNYLIPALLKMSKFLV